MKRKWWLRIATGVCSLLVIGYVGFQIYRSNHSNVQTVMVDDYHYADTVVTEGIFIREETVVTADASKSLRYRLTNGEKVAKNGVIAQVYENPDDIAVKDRIDRLAEEIERFRLLGQAGDFSGIKPETMKERITMQVAMMLQNLNSGRLSDNNSARDQAAYLLEQQKIVMGAKPDFAAKIAALQEEKTALEQRYQKPVDTVYAPLSGYFIAGADGYEQAVAYDDVKELTAAEIAAIAPQELPQGAIGKISASPEWYIACVLPPEDAKKITKGTTVRILLPSVSAEEVSVKVVAFNQPDREADAAVILQGDLVSSNLSSLRKESIQIRVKEYAGLRVDRSAVRIQSITKETTDEDGNTTQETKEVQGVYIVYGEEIRFREIVPLYWEEQFVICESNPADTFSGRPLKRYDEVVIEGKNLYDGKPIR